MKIFFKTRNTVGVREAYNKNVMLHTQKKGEVVRGHKFPSMKPFTYKIKKSRVTLSLNSICTDLKKINGVLVFPEARIPTKNDLDLIENFEQQIKAIQKAKENFINENFLSWDFLSLEEALKIINENRLEWYKNQDAEGLKRAKEFEERERSIIEELSGASLG